MNITLIGLPAAGKTTLGKRLAKELGWDFVDFDDVIIAEFGMRKDIIAEQGEDAMLEIESNVISRAEGDSIVFSPGGSVVLSPPAINHLKSISIVIYLEISLDVLEKRTTDPIGRGVIGARNMALEQIYQIRHELCKKYAQYTVSCNKDDDELQYNLLRTFIKKSFSI